MKIKVVFYLFISLCLFFSCISTEARRPIQKKTGILLEQTIEKNKELNEKENKQILAYIKSDSLHTYITSPKGFWYRYDNKIDKNLVVPIKEDVVTISYEISTLKGDVIYSEQDLGIKKYIVDKENFIYGIQEGIKLMKKGEIVTFVLPSYSAYGVVGDGNKIGIQQTIIIKVKLIEISKKNENN